MYTCHFLCEDDVIVTFTFDRRKNLFNFLGYLREGLSFVCIDDIHFQFVANFSSHVFDEIEIPTCIMRIFPFCASESR